MLSVTGTPDQRATHEPSPGSLPRRDLILLPLISLATLALLCGVSETVARRTYWENDNDHCAELTPAGVREKANCSTHLKNAEGPDLLYSFNGCGYRSSASCGPKTAGSLRVAVMGKSIAMGLYVPYEEMFAARAEHALARDCNRPVDFQNLAPFVLDQEPGLTAEALSLKPDAAILQVAPADLEGVQLHSVVSPAPQSGMAKGVADFFIGLRHNVMMLVAQHYVLQNDDFLYRAYEHLADPDDFLHDPPSPLAESRFANLNTVLAKMAPQFRASGVPFFLLLVPNRMQAGMLSDHVRLPGIDATAFATRVSTIAAANGVPVIDTFPDFAGIRHAERLFYPVDGHPTGQANAVVARAIVTRFSSGSVPGFAMCKPVVKNGNG